MTVQQFIDEAEQGEIEQGSASGPYKDGHAEVSVKDGQITIVKHGVGDNEQEVDQYAID